MSDFKDDEVIILPSLLSYRDTAVHGFVPPSAGAIEAKAAARRRRKLVTGAAVWAALIGVSAILLAQVAPKLGGAEEVGTPTSWQGRAARIEGIVDFRDNGTPLSQDHDWAPQTYPQNPPVGGKHNPVWQQCSGNVYAAAIANEHAVHSMEHGAVWLAYRPDLTAAEVAVLVEKIRGKPYTFLSPYEGLDAKVSLQTWGYQLKLDDVNDPRIDEFISTLAQNATMEPEAACIGGYAGTGTTPLTEMQAQLQFSTR